MAPEASNSWDGTRAEAEPSAGAPLLGHRGRNRLTRIDCVLEGLEDVLPPDDEDGVDPCGEQGSHGVAVETIRLVLQAVDLDETDRRAATRRGRCGPEPRLRYVSPFTDA